MSQNQKKNMIFSYIGFVFKVILVGFARNVLRIGRHVADHRMRDGAVVASFNRSEAYRKRYQGRHFAKIWSPQWT